MVTADSERATQTRQRLLDAAGEVFAEAGFRDGMIREICRRAGANIAAVNYHFGDKERLYSEVVRYAQTCAGSIDLIVASTPTDATSEQKLGVFVHGFLRKIFDPGRPAWHGKLMAREMMDPTGALDEMVENHIRPMFTLLRVIVGELLGAPPEADAVRWNAASIIGQCLFFFQNYPVNIRLYPDLRFDEAHLEALARHITRFSLDGLHGARRSLSRMEAGL